uniref:Uncharacterized protein n=1 Tax=Helianthus annuus TaxID=4232 RepID=A0A251UP84_HELAN
MNGSNGYKFKYEARKDARSLEMNGSNGYKFKYEARKDARSRYPMDTRIALN